MSGATARWAPPRLRGAGDGEGGRHATWLELFFDLVFVVAVAELGRRLHDDVSATGFLAYAALWIPVWWTWLSFTYYADLFDTDDARFRLIVIFGMLLSLALSTQIGEAFGAREAGFAAAVFGLRLVVLGLWLYARRTEPAARGLADRFSLGFAIGALLWGVSVFVPGPARLVLWALASAVEIATPFLAYQTLATPPEHESHLPERTGLFTLIVLGESIVAVAVATDSAGLGTEASVAAALGFAISASIWWTYFEHFDEALITRAVTTGRGAIARSFGYGYGNLLVYAGITAAAIGVEFAIEHATDDALVAGERWALCGGVAVVLLALVGIAGLVRQPVPRPVTVARGAAALAAVALALVGGALDPLVLTGVLAGALALLTVTEIAFPAEDRAAFSRP